MCVVLLAGILGLTTAAPAGGSSLGESHRDWILRAWPQGAFPGLDSTILSELKAYNDIRSAGFAGWDGAGGGMHIITRFGDHPQVHRVKVPGAARVQLTFFPRRVAAFHMNPAGAPNFLYQQDNDGDELFRLFHYDLTTGRAKALGPDSGRVAAVLWSKGGGRFVYTYSPPRSDRWEIRLGDTTGRDAPLFSRPGAWFPVDWSRDGKHLLLIKYVSATASELYHFSLADSALDRLLPGGEESISGAFWLEDETRRMPVTPRSFVFLSDRGGEYRGMYLHRIGGEGKGARGGRDGSSGEGENSPRALGPEMPWDVEWAVPDRAGRRLVYSLNEEGFSRLHLLDLRSGSHRRLKGLPAGIVSGPQFAPAAGKDRGTFAFTLNRSTHPGDVYTHDLASGKTVRWTYSETGGLPPVSFIEPELVSYPTFDSLEGKPRGLSAWLYRPPAPGKRPVIVSLHGGPELQARPGFDAFTQYLAGRKGLAVLRPNVRGSTGYGRAFTRLDDGMLREGAVKDVGALLDWVEKDTLLDAARVAVTGRSYGGYLALSSLVHYGDRLRAGVSTVGIADFVSFLKNTSEYRRDLRRAEYGDERDSRMFAYLKRISPLTHAGRLKTPLLLGHGRQDPRVPYSESVTLFETLRKKNVPVWFLTFLREGHAFREPENRLVHEAVQTQFLLRHFEKGP